MLQGLLLIGKLSINYNNSFLFALRFMSILVELLNMFSFKFDMSTGTIYPAVRTNRTYHGKRKPLNSAVSNPYNCSESLVTSPHTWVNLFVLHWNRPVREVVYRIIHLFMLLARTLHACGTRHVTAPAWIAFFN